MVEFSFNPLDHEPYDYKAETPVQLATRLWFDYTTFTLEIDTTHEAFERAQWDPEAWDSLLTWGREQEELSGEWKIALFDLWKQGRPKAPRKGHDLPTVFRNEVLHRISLALRERFPDMPMRNKEAVGGACVCAVLATLPVGLSEGAIAKIAQDWRGQNAP